MVLRRIAGAFHRPFSRSDGTQATPRWGTVCIVREPTDLLIAFAAYHLSVGAEQILLYFDTPDDPAADILEQIGGVFVTRCTDSFWKPLGGPPLSLDDRQKVIVDHARKRAQVDWIAHIDADEFLHMPNGLHPSFAAMRERDHSWIKIPVAERVWLGTPDPGTLFGGAFRSPIEGSRKEVMEVYGTGLDFLFPMGTAGHPFGKPLGKVRAPEQVFEVHRVVSLAGDRLPACEARQVKLLHFEGLTPLHWGRKILRKALEHRQSPLTIRRARLAMIESIVQAPDPGATVLEWYDRVHVLQAGVAERLRAHNALSEITLDIRSAIETHAPGMTVDLTFAGIDAALRADFEAARAALITGR